MSGCIAVSVKICEPVLAERGREVDFGDPREPEVAEEGRIKT